MAALGECEMPYVPHWIWLLIVADFCRVLLVFIAVELIAVFNQPSGDTFTELVVQHLHPPSIAFFLLIGVSITILAWTGWHFIVEEDLLR